MSEILRPDLCVIGAGSGGLSIAAGAAQMGASVVLVERDRMGGDCLNTGCVPSKALIAAAAAAHAARTASRFGIDCGTPQVDMPAVRAHVRDVIAQIAPHDSAARFEGLGVRVLRHHATFVDPRTVLAGDTTIRARRFVVATGSHPVVPPIAGLDLVPFLTNETVFDLDVLPAHLLVVGGGPIGVELGQAFRRLGSAVTIIEMAEILGAEDPELAALARATLTAEGAALMPRTRVEAVRAEGNTVVVETDGGHVRGSHLLLAVGRKAVVDGLGLAAAEIESGPGGIVTDAGLRSSNRRVYAIGDVAGHGQSTHLAAYHAGIVIRNALFRLPSRAKAAIPRVTYMDPELAAVGLGEAEARARHGSFVQVLRAPFADNDRARAERSTEGLVKVVVTRRGRILGAAIYGRHAGELIQPWILAIGKGLRIDAMATLVAPYPTLGEASKRAAGAFYTERLFSPRTQRLVRFLRRFG
ncbi:MAG: dihydrolipoyl dehydrogenase family protein [Alphaproteobacteria bacterium]